MRRNGFTLLEVLLSVLILAMISVMIFGSFRSITESIMAAEQAMDSLHHGEIVLEQLVSSLRSTAFYETTPGAYTFLHEKGTGKPPDDMLSWVSGTMAFLPPRYPTRQGLNRIFLSIEEIDGQRGLAVSAYPHLSDPDDAFVEEVDPWMISPRVLGLQARFYNLTTNTWEEEWLDERQIPAFIEITLFLEALEEGGDLREVVRVIDVPVARISREVRRGRRQQAQEGAGGAPAVDTGGGRMRIQMPDGEGPPRGGRP